MWAAAGSDSDSAATATERLLIKRQNHGRSSYRNSCGDVDARCFPWACNAFQGVSIADIGVQPLKS